MGIRENIFKLRSDAKLSQEQLAEKLGVSRQAIQKWESGAAAPELPNLTQLARLFGTTLDSLVFDSDTRVTEELKNVKKLRPSTEYMHSWELYSAQLLTEYRQCVDEGLDIEGYKSLFEAVSAMPTGEDKEKMADVLFNIVLNAPIKSGFKYDEPSDLERIFALRDGYRAPSGKVGDMRDKIAGAWYGRICGCLLGKPVEGIRTEELLPLLKQSGNYPMHRYINSGDVTEKMRNECKFRFAGRCFADTVKCGPVDDDTNYTVLYQVLISERGRDFTPTDVSRLWVSKQSKDAYCTAERVAFRNFINGFLPPESAMYKNAYREWIGAQIRGDYFGYINPGDPEGAAAMAWKDACIAQVKNGVYGEMFVAAMLACAAVTDDIEKIIRGGLSQIPATSRLHERICAVIDGYNGGVSESEFFSELHRRYDEHDGHDWCHTVSNAEIVAASLLYGGGQYGRSVCMAVEQGFDTDCNGATVGSVLGMRGGMAAVGEEWSAPLHGELDTSIFGVGRVKIDSLVDKTLEHIGK